MKTIKLTKGTTYDVDAVRFADWHVPAGCDTDPDNDGYHYGNYFDAEGRYLGPDADGIEPLFRSLDITIGMIDAGTGAAVELSAATLEAAMAIVRAAYPAAVDVTGSWAGCGSGTEERQIVADDSDDAPVVAVLRRAA